MLTATPVSALGPATYLGILHYIVCKGRLSFPLSDSPPYQTALWSDRALVRPRSLMCYGVPVTDSALPHAVKSAPLIVSAYATTHTWTARASYLKTTELLRHRLNSVSQTGNELRRSPWRGYIYTTLSIAFMGRSGVNQGTENRSSRVLSKVIIFHLSETGL